MGSTPSLLPEYSEEENYSLKTYNSRSYSPSPSTSNISDTLKKAKEAKTTLIQVKEGLRLMPSFGGYKEKILVLIDKFIEALTQIEQIKL